VGIWFSRSDYLSSFVSCFLPTVFVYYPLMLCGGNLAKDGKVPPWAGVFAADAVLAVAAVVLTWRLIRK
jgi:lipopolysaccharide export system permease protein